MRVSSVAAGVDFTGVYARRQRDAEFACAWARVLRERELEGAPRPCSTWPPFCSSAGEELVVRSSADGSAKLVRAGAGRWSAARETRFFLALAECANVRRSAAAAGVSTQAIYARRLKDRGFRARWDAAIDAGKARLEAYLIEAADRSFDPAGAAEAGDELPRVTVAEAIAILRLKGSRAQAATAADQDEEEGGAQEYQEACERVAARLRRMAARQRTDWLEAGWREFDGEMVPPGFVRIGDSSAGSADDQAGS